MIHIHLRRFCQMCGKKTNLKRLKKYSHKHVQLLSFWYFNKNIINFLYLFLSTTAILFAQLFPLKVNEKGKKKRSPHTLRSHFFISVLPFCDIHVSTSYHSCATNSRNKLETLQCYTHDVLASTCDFVYIVLFD